MIEADKDRKKERESERERPRPAELFSKEILNGKSPDIRVNM